MIQRIFSVIIIMVFLFLLMVMQQVLIIVHFKLNQEAIEQKFCINKDRPELKCKGICYLKKELQKTENKDSEIISLYKEFKMISVTHFEFETIIKQITTDVKIIFYRVLFPLDPYLEVFTPPPELYFESPF